MAAEDPPTRQVSINLKVDAGNRVDVEVADRCGGLPKGIPERFFAPFFQASGDRTGLGLGLALTRKVVEAARE